MTETNLSPLSEATPCQKKTKPFLWFLSGILLMTIATAALFVYAFRIGGIVPVPRGEGRQVEEINRRVDALERQFNALVQLSPMQQTVGEAVPLDEELKKLKEKIEGATSRETEAAQKTVAAAFAFLDLRDEARRGGSFEIQLAALREASDDPKVEELAARLSPYASGGTMTASQLREELSIAEKNVPPPAAETKTGSIIARIKAVLRPLISVKPVHDPRFYAIEKRLDEGDVVGALESLRALPPEVRNTLESMEKHMESRAELDTTLKTLTSFFMTAPAQRSAQ